MKIIFWKSFWSPFSLFLLFSTNYLVLCKEDKVFVKVYNYLDISDNEYVNFTITDVLEVDPQEADVLTYSSHTPYPCSYVDYSEHCSIEIHDSEESILLLNISYYSVDGDIDENHTTYYLPDLIEISFNGSFHNVSITIYGLLNDSKSLLDHHFSQNKLGIDEASLEITNRIPFPVNYSELSENCYKCSAKKVGVVLPGQAVFLSVSTRFKMTYFFQSTVNVCRPLSFHFKEHYYYSYEVNTDPSRTAINTSCSLIRVSVDELQNTYMPILYVGIILIGSFLIWTVGTKVYMLLHKRGLLHVKKIDRQLSKDIGDPEVVQKEYGAVNKSERDLLLSSSSEKHKSDLPQLTSAPAKKQRLKSLDTIRGLSLIIMIFVNYGGGGYWFFAHSKWNGITVADLVFPWFVWIMGVSIVFSFRGRKKDSFAAQLYQVLRRSVILMCLGLFLNNGYDLSHWRIPGVLQRFAASYFFVALTELLTVRFYSSFTSKFSKFPYFNDVIYNSVQWVLILVLELLWLSLTFGLSVPGCPRGYLGPGGLSEEGKYQNCTGGAAGYIDKSLLSDSHIYKSPTCKKLYQTGPYEPEGILGTLNSIVICFLGVQAGRIIIYHQNHYSRLLRFIIWGISLGGIATILCEGQKNEGFIPLNKNLWSLSFILLMAGMGFILLAVFYFLIDVIKVWNGAPFIYPGMNSILVYVGSELLEGMFPFGWQGMENTHLTLLISNVISVSLWTLIAYYWFVIKFFVKI